LGLLIGASNRAQIFQTWKRFAILSTRREENKADMETRNIQGSQPQANDTQKFLQKGDRIFLPFPRSLFFSAPNVSPGVSPNRFLHEINL